MASQRTPLHYGWIVLAMATLVVSGALGLARFGYSMVLPDMQQGLSMDDTGAGLLASANLIGYLVLALVGGALASRFGPRVVITAGLALCGLSMLFTGAVQTFAGALIWRTVTGIGSGASNVPAMGLLTAWFAPRRRGLAMGIGVAGSAVALVVLGPVVPRVLETHGADGWRVCWYGFGAVALLLAVMAFLILRNSPREMGLAAVASDQPQADAQPAASAKVGALDWGAVYRSGAVWHLGLVYIAFGFSYIIYMTFFVRYLVGEFDYTKPEAGNLFMMMGWVSLFCGLIWGTVSDRIGRKRALVIVYLIHAIAFGLFGLWTEPVGFTISAILFGLTAWSIPAIVSAACGDVVGPRLAPAAVGFVTLLFSFGQASGPTVAGAIADASGSLSPAMVLAAGVALLGAIGSATLRTDRGAERKE